MIPVSKQAFWDTDLNSIDPVANADFVIRKIFDRGAWNEMKWCDKNYGSDKVASALMNARSLRPEVVRLAAVLYNLDETKFRCYTNPVWNKEH